MRNPKDFTLTPEEFEHHKQRLDVDGYTVVPGVLPKELCEQYKVLLEDLYAKYSPLYAGPIRKSEHKLEDKSDEKCVFNLHNKDRSFVDLIDLPVSYPLISHMLQQGSYEDSDPFALTLTSARTPLKNRPLQQLHMDARYPAGKRALYCIVMYCLDEFTFENGATKVVPGSHLFGGYAPNGVRNPNEKALVGPQGSLMIYNSSLWHGSGTNITDGTRWCLVFSYGRWIMKPFYNFNKNMPRKIYDTLTDREKELLGYRFNPPVDEFTRQSLRSNNYEEPEFDYQLPKPFNS